MKALPHAFTVRIQQGFEVYTLHNDEVEIDVVPELGAKIISLKNLRTGRQWMWHPPAGCRLFSNCPGDDFSQSPLIGADECFPTIAPCVWQGRKLPDHGEVWNAPWQVDAKAWADGLLKTSVRLNISPFELNRTIELQGRDIRINYHLENLSPLAEAFLWAFHPLLNLLGGDHLVLPASTRVLLNGATWVDSVPLSIPEQSSAKVFAQPLTEGLTGIHNRFTGDRLEFEWNPSENNTLGLWLTRGAWYGYHQFAIEPTNAGTDSLARAMEQNHCRMVPAFTSVSWQIRLRVGAG
jgi:hypothetical protein